MVGGSKAMYKMRITTNVIILYRLFINEIFKTTVLPQMDSDMARQLTLLLGFARMDFRRLEREKQTGCHRFAHRQVTALDKHRR